MNMDRQKLESRLNEINTSIDELCEEQQCIYKKLQEINKAEWTLTNNILNIKLNSVIVAVAKHPDYHYTLIDIFIIKDLAHDNGFRGINLNYRYDDYTYSFKSSKMYLSEHIFDDLKKTHYLYNVSQEDLTNLISKCLGLEVKFEDLQDTWCPYLRQHALGVLELKEN